MNEFETMMTQLEEITEKLENGDLSLDESMKLFEQGVTLTKACSALLDEAQQKIVKITVGETGEVTEEPFEIEEA